MNNPKIEKMIVKGIAKISCVICARLAVEYIKR